MTSTRTLVHVVPPLETPLRLDRYVAEHLGLFSRSQAERRGLEALCNGQPAKSSLKLVGGESLELTWHDPPEVTFEAEPLDLDVLFENDSVIVINKARGVVVHPAHGNWSGTLVQGLLHRWQELSEAFDDEVGAELRPGIVHRLDKDTSGVLIAAKHPEALEWLAAQFRDRSTKKEYWAIVKSRPRARSGVVRSGLGRDPKNRQRFAAFPEGQGKSAVTEWECVASTGLHSLMRYRPLTGRTHQLRVHSVVLGCPIVGDPIYSRTDSALPGSALLLHAAKLTLVLPRQTSPSTFIAPFPADFQGALERLGLPTPPIAAPD